ncbi:MAG TPA: hypothetical protein VEA38_22995 [Terriglobales bacterium]|nr:hypothetical protein [Terriglobales bacterium]
MLISVCERAFWITSWPFAEYVKHAWAGAWVCSAFRNEGAGLSSELIREAVAATRAIWPDVPALGLVTFVDPTFVRTTNPGCCYRAAGFKRATPRTTEAGLPAFQLLPADMPPAEAALPALPRPERFYSYVPKEPR